MYISATIIFFKVMRVRTSSTIPCIGIRFAEFSGAAVIRSAKKRPRTKRGPSTGRKRPRWVLRRRANAIRIAKYVIVHRTNQGPF